MSYVQCFEYHCHTYVQLEVPVVISLSFHLFLEIGGPSRDFPLFSSIYGDWRFQQRFSSPLFRHWRLEVPARISLSSTLPFGIFHSAF